MIKDVSELDVYQRALKALHLIYQLAKQIPPSHVKLRNQLTSAAESIPANLAEGFAKRKSAQEFKRFLHIALGSSDEVITHARTAHILSQYHHTLNPNLIDKVEFTYKIISKQINTLHKNWIDYQVKTIKE